MLLKSNTDTQIPQNYKDFLFVILDSLFLFVHVVYIRNCSHVKMYLDVC